MNVRDSVCCAPRIAAVHSSCRADGGQARQVGKTVDVAGRVSWTCSARGFGLCSENAELNAVKRIAPRLHNFPVNMPLGLDLELDFDVGFLMLDEYSRY